MFKSLDNLRDFVKESIVTNPIPTNYEDETLTRVSLNVLKYAIGYVKDVNLVKNQEFRKLMESLGYCFETKTMKVIFSNSNKVILNHEHSYVYQYSKLFNKWDSDMNQRVLSTMIEEVEKIKNKITEQKISDFSNNKQEQLRDLKDDHEPDVMHNIRETKK